MARRVLTITLLTLAVLIAAGIVGWRLNLRERSRYTDANTINAPLASAPIRQILWQPAARLSDAGDSTSDQYEPRVSADGQTMIFVRGQANAGNPHTPRNADLYQCRRTSQGWSPPEPVKAINTESDELGPELSPDGRTLYFYSDRAGTLGGYDLWLSRRDDGGDWKEPVNLGQSVNTEFNEYGPALTPDTKRLFFSSNRPRPGDPPQAAQRDPWPATLRENRTRHDYDLYVLDFEAGVTDSTAPSGLIGPSASPVRELNTPHDEGAPAVSPAGDFLYFASDRPQSTGGFDIFRSRILRGEVQPPENLGSAINTANNDLDPSLSTDGFRIYFSSDRARSDRAMYSEGNQASPPASEQQAAEPRADEPARYALYSSSSREVFVETDPLQAASLLARLWAAAWPWLLALLAAAILAILFYLAMRDAAIRHRLAQLSLMAKCLLISLLIHAALLSAFAAWRVGTAIGDMLRDGGAGNGTQVTLGASAGEGSLESQIRGSLTTVGIEVPTIEASRPDTTPLDIQAPSIQVATTPANLTFTISPVTFRPEDATAPVASPTPSTPSLNETVLAVRTPATEPAPVPSSESRSEIAVDAARIPARSASIAGAATTPTSVAMNPAPAPIATPSPSAAGSPIADAPATLAAGAPPASSSPLLPAVGTPASLSSRLPSAPAGTATAAEPALASASIATPTLPASSQPSLPGGAAPSAVAINPGPAPIGAPAPSSAPNSISEPSSTIAAGAPSAASSPLLAGSPASGTAAAARLPRATPSVATSSEPPAASGSIAAASLPTTSQPPLPGAASVSRVAVAPAAAAMAIQPGAAAAFQATDAPSASGSVPTAPRAASSIPPTAGGAAIAARLPGGLSTPSAGTVSEAPSASAGTLLPALGDTAQPSLALSASSGSSVHLTPPTSKSGSLAPPPSASTTFAPSETASAPGLAGSAPAAGGADLKTLPSIAFKSNLPAIPAAPADPPKTTPAPKPETFAQRAPEVRQDVLKKTGGSPETERAVAAALDWFKAHQSADGRWSGQHFDRNCTHCSSPAEIDADAAMTGITLLCYLGAGHTHLADGPHKDGVKKALMWIVNRTDSSGDLRRGETMYSQTIAAIALCEAFAMTRDPWLETPARRSITFAARGAQGGRGRDSADTSVLGWQIMAVKSAQRAGFDVPTTAFDAARRWLDQVSSANAPGRYAYRPGEQPSPAATAEAMFVQQLLGHSRDEPRMRQSADFILTAPPAWRREAPTYYWYYATLALFQQQGPHWKTWNEGMARELIRNQHQDGPSKGSWDPQDPWSRLGGRVYQTAVCTLSLEVYYRYRLAEPAN